LSAKTHIKQMTRLSRNLIVRLSGRHLWQAI
jgi:hypothetical protein